MAMARQWLRRSVFACGVVTSLNFSSPYPFPVPLHWAAEGFSRDKSAMERVMKFVRRNKTNQQRAKTYIRGISDVLNDFVYSIPKHKFLKDVSLHLEARLARSTNHK